MRQSLAIFWKTLLLVYYRFEVSMAQYNLLATDTVVLNDIFSNEKH